MDLRYDHFGVPVREKEAGMVHFPRYRVWCSDYEKDPYRVERIFFEKGSPFHPLIQTIPHVCFLVADLRKAIAGKKLLLEPVEEESYAMAFIEERGVPIEFIQIKERR